MTTWEIFQGTSNSKKSAVLVHLSVFFHKKYLNNNNNNNNNNNKNNNNNPRDQEILGWCPVGDSLISWGEGSFLALLSNSSRDSVSIKILVWRHLKPNHVIMSGFV